MTALRVLTAVGSALALVGAVHQEVNLRALRVPAADRPARGRAGVGARAGPRRGAPHHADRALAAGPARCRRPGDPRPGRRLDRRHGATSVRARRPAATPGYGCCPAPRRRPACRASRTPAPSSRPRPAARVLVFVDADVVLAAARRRGRGRGAARRRARPALARGRASSPTACGPAGAAAAAVVVDGVLPLRRAERSAQPALCAANGQFLVVDAAALATAGGFAGGRREVLDDIAVARAIKRVRRPGRGRRRLRHRRVPHVRGLGASLRAGYRKSLWAAFGPARRRAAVGARADAGLPRAAARGPGGIPGRAGRLRRRAWLTRVRRRPPPPRAGVAGRAGPPGVRRRAAGAAACVVARAPAAAR